MRRRLRVSHDNVDCTQCAQDIVDGGVCAPLFSGQDVSSIFPASCGTDISESNPCLADVTEACYTADCPACVASLTDDFCATFMSGGDTSDSWPMNCGAQGECIADMAAECSGTTDAPTNAGSLDCDFCDGASMNADVVVSRHCDISLADLGTSTCAEASLTDSIQFQERDGDANQCQADDTGVTEQLCNGVGGVFGESTCAILEAYFESMLGASQQTCDATIDGTTTYAQAFQYYGCCDNSGATEAPTNTGNLDCDQCAQDIVGGNICEPLFNNGDVSSISFPASCGTDTTDSNPCLGTVTAACYVADCPTCVASLTEDFCAAFTSGGDTSGSWPMSCGAQGECISEIGVACTGTNSLDCDFCDGASVNTNVVVSRQCDISLAELGTSSCAEASLTDSIQFEEKDGDANECQADDPMVTEQLCDTIGGSYGESTCATLETYFEYILGASQQTCDATVGDGSATYKQYFQYNGCCDSGGETNCAQCAQDIVDAEICVPLFSGADVSSSWPAASCGTLSDSNPCYSDVVQACSSSVADCSTCAASFSDDMCTMFTSGTDMGDLWPSSCGFQNECISEISLTCVQAPDCDWCNGEDFAADTIFERKCTISLSDLGVSSCGEASIASTQFEQLGDDASQCEAEADAITEELCNGIGGSYNEATCQNLYDQLTLVLGTQQQTCDAIAHDTITYGDVFRYNGCCGGGVQDWDATWQACPTWAAYAVPNCPTGPDSCTTDPTLDQIAAICAEFQTEPCASDPLAQAHLAENCSGDSDDTNTFHRLQDYNGDTICVELNLPSGEDNCDLIAGQLGNNNFNSGACSNSDPCSSEISNLATSQFANLPTACPNGSVDAYCASGDSSGGDSGEESCSESDDTCSSGSYCNDSSCESCDEVLDCHNNGIDSAQSIANCVAQCAKEPCGSDSNCGNSCESEPTTCSGLQSLVDGGCASDCSQCVVDLYNNLLSCEGDDRATVTEDGTEAPDADQTEAPADQTDAPAEQTEAPTTTAAKSEVTFQLTVSMTSDEFESNKAALTTSVANSCGVQEEDVELTLVTTRRRRLSTSTVQAKITTETTNVATLTDTITGDTFSNSLQTEMENFPELADVTVSEVSTPQVENL